MSNHKSENPEKNSAKPEHKSAKFEHKSAMPVIKICEV